MPEDDAKKAILARRARFVAAAMMGAGLVSCDRKSGEPTVCLSIAVPSSADAAPTPCLTVLPPPPTTPDAGASVSDDGGAGDAGATDGGARPTVRRPKPRICLSFSDE
jgi:hypothetical protein